MGIFRKYFTQNKTDISLKEHNEYYDRQSKYRTSIDEHFGYVEQLPQLYKMAREAGYKSAKMEKCIQLCKKDIDLAASLKKYFLGNDGCLPRYPSFSQLAIIYEKQGEIQKAIEICEKAIQLGFENDGTKAGMKGRLKRLQNKKHLYAEMGK